MSDALKLFELETDTEYLNPSRFELVGRAPSAWISSCEFQFCNTKLILHHQKT
jgi:hypothetical protein